MFDIRTFNYSSDSSKKDFENWVLENDYHSLYILENGVDAYIGETLRISARATEHLHKCQKYDFKRMHVITADFMEETPAKHYERLLIKLMKTDGSFHVVNKNNGDRTHYRRVNEFELLFDQLWDQLEAKKLVKKKSFRQIFNSSTYKYSPYTILTEEQESALTHIMNVLDTGETTPYTEEYERRPILINGSAGTGKTVVATTLFHGLKNHIIYKNKTMALVVANEQMRTLLKNVFAEVGEGLCRKDVIAPIELTKRKYDIIICDETHALRRRENLVFYKKHFDDGNSNLEFDDTHDELDWILAQSLQQILFYDAKQMSKRSDIRDEYVQERIHNNRYRGYRSIELRGQMRIKAGDSYIAYIYDILYQRTSEKRCFINYDFKLFSSFKEMREEISKKESLYGLSKLCSGYAWKWVSKKDQSLFDIYIEGIGIRWNRDKKNWIGNQDSTHEMGSIYTLRGIDLNYVGLVIGPDLYFDKEQGVIKVNDKSLFSNDVKKGATKEEINEYILNTYAILLTRAIEGTYVYVYDDALREYFSSFIECV